MKKRLLSVLLTGMMISITLSGCGKKEEFKDTVVDTVESTQAEESLEESLEESKEAVESTEAEENVEETLESETESEEGTETETETGETKEVEASEPKESVEPSKEVVEESEEQKPAPAPEPKPESKPEPTPTPAPTPAPTPTPTPTPAPAPTPEPAPAPSTHTHSYKDVVTKEAGCANAKEIARKCSCGHVESTRTEGSALGHNYVERVYQYPVGCLGEGWMSVQCSRCNEYQQPLGGYVIEAPGHTWEEVVMVEGDCNSPQIREQRCKVCGMQGVTIYDRDVHANDHVWITETYEEWSDEAWGFVEVERVCCGECNAEPGDT